MPTAWRTMHMASTAHAAPGSRSATRRGRRDGSGLAAIRKVTAPLPPTHQDGPRVATWARGSRLAAIRQVIAHRPSAAPSPPTQRNAPASRRSRLAAIRQVMAILDGTPRRRDVGTGRRWGRLRLTCVAAWPRSGRWRRSRPRGPPFARVAFTGGSRGWVAGSPGVATWAMWLLGRGPAGATHAARIPGSRSAKRRSP